MVIEKARELGIALSECEEYTSVRAAQEAIERDENVSAAIEDFNQKQGKLYSLMSEEDYDADYAEALSDELEHIRAELMQNELFSELIEAQNQFQTLMSRVNKIIGVCIGAEDTDSADCGGSCEACHGCKH